MMCACVVPGARRARLLPAAARYAKCRQPGGNRRALRRGIDPLVDVHDAAVEADVERPACGKRLICIHHAVGRGDGLRRVAQQRVVQAQRLRERPVSRRIIDTDGKVGDVETPDLFATLTE